MGMGQAQSGLIRAAGSQEGNWVGLNLGKAWNTELWAFSELTSFFLFGQPRVLGSLALCSHSLYLIVFLQPPSPLPSVDFLVSLEVFKLKVLSDSKGQEWMHRKDDRSTWLAQWVDHLTLDTGVVSSSCMLGVEAT